MAGHDGIREAAEAERGTVCRQYANIPIIYQQIIVEFQSGI